MAGVLVRTVPLKMCKSASTLLAYALCVWEGGVLVQKMCIFERWEWVQNILLGFKKSWKEQGGIKLRLVNQNTHVTSLIPAIWC